MDVVTLAMAKPKVIALWDFYCKQDETNTDFNTAVILTLNESFAGAGVCTITAEDRNGALKKACSVNRSINVRLSMNGSILEAPATISRDADGKAEQISAGSVMLVGEIALSIHFAIQFYADSTITNVMVAIAQL